MFSLEIIIPIIVVAAVCAVYIILRGRRDERRAREVEEMGGPVSGRRGCHAPCA